MTEIGVRVSGTANKPPLEVWEFMVDPARLHEWVKDVEPGGSWIDSGSAGVVGSRYRIDYSYARDTREVVFEVTASVAGELFSLNTVSGPYPIVADYELAASGYGKSTVVVYTMTARSDSWFTAVLFVATKWLSRPFMRRQLRKGLRNLRDAMDSGD
jgi:uncharacterized protein YndB with AHSA1/START domain